jgi:hypothetical protein
MYELGDPEKLTKLLLYSKPDQFRSSSFGFFCARTSTSDYRVRAMWVWVWRS